MAEVGVGVEQIRAVDNHYYLLLGVESPDRFPQYAARSARDGCRIQRDVVPDLLQRTDIRMPV
jgi:hypothetical protein